MHRRRRHDDASIRFCRSVPLLADAAHRVRRRHADRRWQQRAWFAAASAAGRPRTGENDLRRRSRALPGSRTLARRLHDRRRAAIARCGDESRVAWSSDARCGGRHHCVSGFTSSAGLQSRRPVDRPRGSSCNRDPRLGRSPAHRTPPCRFRDTRRRGSPTDGEAVAAASRRGSISATAASDVPSRSSARGTWPGAAHSGMRFVWRRRSA